MPPLLHDFLLLAIENCRINNCLTFGFAVCLYHCAGEFASDPLAPFLACLSSHPPKSQTTHIDTNLVVIQLFAVAEPRSLSYMAPAVPSFIDQYGVPPRES